MKTLLRRFTAEERGTAMTEFVMFLPIFIVAFIGIINLAQAHIHHTKVDIIAQRQLWETIIPISDGDGDGPHMVPASGAATAGSEYNDLAGTDGNPHSALDRKEGITYAISLGSMGHWGESWERAKLTEPLHDVDVTQDPTDILGEREDNELPHLMLNDRLIDVVDSFEGSGNIMSVISGFVAASGVVAAQAAGNRYGVVFSEHEDSFELMNGIGTVDSSAHYDLLVPPVPLKGAEHELKTFGIAWLLAQGVDNYYDTLEFGADDDTWPGDEGVPEEANQDAPSEDEFEEDAEDSGEECKEEQEELDERLAEDDDDDGVPNSSDTDYTGPTEISQECQDAANR